MKRRILAICLCALFLLAALISFAFIAEAAGHDCTGEDCPICAEVAVCASLLHRLSLCFVVFLCLFCAFFIMRQSRTRPHLFVFHTPISRFDVLNS